MTKVKVVEKAKEKYEIPHCPDCEFYKKECDMKRLDTRDFDPSLTSIFPDDPLLAELYKGYKEPKLHAVPMPDIDEKFLMMIGGKYAYPEQTVLYPVSMFKLSTKKSHKDIHDSFSSDNVGLVISAKDEFLLNFIETGNRTKDITWTDKIKMRNFDFVFAPNISFYYNQPSCATVFNRFITYKSLMELNEAKIPTIPSVLYLWDSDIEQYAKWIKKSGYRYVYYNVQLAIKESVFQSTLRFLEKLHELLDDVGIILLGVFDHKRITALERIREFKYVNSHLHILSTRRVLWKNNIEVKQTFADGMYYEDVMKKNIVNYRKFMEKKI